MEKKMLNDDTIFALSTGFVKSGIAVVRVSGNKTKEVLEILCNYKDPKAGYAKLCKIKNKDNLIDTGIVLYFKSPKSYTGEDMAEFHIHGGRAVIADTLIALNKIEGLRLAEKGEFTKRAVLNGKIDLTAAEGIADLIDANTTEQRKQALRQVNGELFNVYERWRTTLVKILAHFEAYIDFPEDDIPKGIINDLEREVLDLLGEVDKHLSDNHKGEILRRGYYITIVGSPNVGKSSILNRLVKKDAAIVSSMAGTTRDIIEVLMDIDGFPIVFSDTAGLRSSGNVIELEGIKRAREKAKNSNLKLAVFDGGNFCIDKEIKDIIDDDTLIIINKQDLLNAEKRKKIKDVITSESLDFSKCIFISAKNNTGFTDLLDKIVVKVSNSLSQNEEPALTNIRYRNALEKCEDALQRSLMSTQIDLKAEDLRLAARYIGIITGIVNIEEVLDIIFKDFCIGK